MLNGRESTQNLQVGFGKNPQSHSPEPHKNNVVTIQTMGRGINHNAWEENREAQDHTWE